MYRQWARQSLPGPSTGSHWFQSDLGWGEACYPLSAAFLWDLTLCGFSMTLCLSCLCLSTESEQG